MRVAKALAAEILADEAQKREAIKRRVLGYLLRHPAAADSIEGVRSWWLREGGSVSQAELQIALDDLFQRGWLLKRGDHAETRIYYLNDWERAAVERYVGGEGQLDG